MSDTASKIAALAAERHRRMSAEDRLKIASAMFDDARAIVAASLPQGLTRAERRLALARRFHGNELTEAALIAFAEWSGAED